MGMVMVGNGVYFLFFFLPCRYSFSLPGAFFPLSLRFLAQEGFNEGGHNVSFLSKSGGVVRENRAARIYGIDM
jgi:hypothetical protein